MKLFLNLSKEEQRMRFLKRIDLPEHNWKFSGGRPGTRHWDDYQTRLLRDAVGDRARRAPWYVIPADRKWFARICAARSWRTR